MDESFRYEVRPQEVDWGVVFQATSEFTLFGKTYKKGQDVPYNTQQEFRVLRHLVQEGAVATVKQRRRM